MPSPSSHDNVGGVEQRRAGALTEGGHRLVAGAVCEDGLRRKGGGEDGAKGRSDWVVDDTVEARPLRAGVHVAAASLNDADPGRRAERHVAAPSAVDVGAGPIDVRHEEEVDGEGGAEVVGVAEAEEVAGGVDLARLGDDGHPTPEGEGAARRAPVQQARATSGGGGGKGGEEGHRCHHCRGCALRVWVASGIEGVQIEEEASGGRRVDVVVVGAAVGAAPKDDGGGRDAAVDEARVEGREAARRRQDVEVRVHRDSAVGGSNAVPRSGDAALVGKSAGGAELGELTAMERRHPTANVVPDGSPTAVPRRVVVRGGAGVIGVEAHA